MAAGTSPPSLSSPPPLAPALDRALLAGIAAYRRHPYQRTLPDPPTVWAESDSRLIDYGGAGPPVLFVPSLINRAYVLDLLPERSMLRWLAAGGVRPLLLDWGWPGPDERRAGLAVPIGRLGRAIDAARTHTDGPIVLAGYCMGGLLALAAAAEQPGAIRALALLATPWDFAAGSPLPAETVDRYLLGAEPIFAATGTLPVDALGAIFDAAAPGAIAAKFRAFGGRPQDDPAARDFVALEDWLNDGVPLAAPVAREVFGSWYRDNQPGRDVWAPIGRPVRPATLTCRSFVAVPAADRIVPPATALPLAAALPGSTLHRPAAGHVGMVAGPRAEAMLWQPLLDWLRGV